MVEKERSFKFAVVREIFDEGVVSLACCNVEDVPGERVNDKVLRSLSELLDGFLGEKCWVKEKSVNSIEI